MPAVAIILVAYTKIWLSSRPGWGWGGVGGGGVETWTAGVVTTVQY